MGKFALMAVFVGQLFDSVFGAPQCPDENFELFNDTCYADSPSLGVYQKSWQGAVDICAGYGGIPLVTNTREEFDFALSVLRKRGATYNRVGCKASSRGRFTCLDNKAYYNSSAEFSGYWPWKYSPDMNATTEQCGVIADVSFGPDFLPQPCLATLNFICETPKVGPTTVTPSSGEISTRATMTQNTDEQAYSLWDKVQHTARFASKITWRRHKGECGQSHVIVSNTALNTVICAARCASYPRCQAFCFYADEGRCEMIPQRDGTYEMCNLDSHESCSK